MADAVKFIQLVVEEEEEETEQDWPADKVDIMEELESERPMSVEFKNLSCGSATQPLADQYNSAKENQTRDGNRHGSNINRGVKDMFTNAPADSILELPEPFRTAVQNSLI
ncbi:hypothetical protein GX48_03844 [Paracoccidioides brasiliensis]|nr:hypothetical protein GX48_03844 [Paracoccidioides brasiliensis]